MLTNLNWLSEGATYPPVPEVARINLYIENDKLFLTKHDVIWKSAFDQIAQRLKKSNIVVDTIFNYHQLLSKKIADFVCGEPPAITAGDNTDKLLEILSREEFDSKLYESVIDISKLGNGVFKILGDELAIVDAKYWFPISDPSNLKKPVYHVIAYPITPDSDGKLTELYVEVHSIGSIDIRIYGFEGTSLKGTVKTLKSTTVQNTGLEDFAVVPLTNTTYSGNYFGIDDYAIINSIIKKIMWRLACGDKVMDKHSDPSLSGPSSALEQDPQSGMWFLNLSNYFKRDSATDPDVNYITWDGNLDANFKAIDLLFDQLYILSEMGSAFLEGSKSGSGESGEALKVKMISQRVKARRIVGTNAEKVKTLVMLLANVNGIKLNRNDITITWKEGLPTDEAERTRILASAVGDKPLMSQYNAIMKYQELSDKDTEKELERIRQEEAASLPNILGGGV